MSIHLADVQQELADLKSRVEGLQRTVDLMERSPAAENPLDHTHAVLVFTRELFPGEVTTVETADQEIPDHRHLVFQVTAHGSVDELAARNHEWHRRLCQLEGRIPGRYRLSIRVT